MAVHGSDEMKPLACMQCGKRFLNNSALACHIKVHSDENGNYDCPICGAPFSQIHTLKEHVHIHRGQDGHYSCPHCPKVPSENNLVTSSINLLAPFAYGFACMFKFLPDKNILHSIAEFPTISADSKAHQSVPCREEVPLRSMQQSFHRSGQAESSHGQVSIFFHLKSIVRKP